MRIKIVTNTWSNIGRIKVLNHLRNTIQIRSKILGQTSKELTLKSMKPPFGTVDAAGVDNTASMNTSLSRGGRKKFLLSPEKAWN